MINGINSSVVNFNNLIIFSFSLVILQALVDITQYYEMNEHANRKILAHTQKKHQSAMREAAIQHDRDISVLDDNNIQLLESLSNQSSLVALLKSQNMDSAQVLTSLTQLVDEKDKVSPKIQSFWGNLPLATSLTNSCNN